MGVLRQLVIWATFANQLSALKKEGRDTLDKVYDHLLSTLQECQDEPESTLRWQVLIVGWEHFCRTASQQVDAL
jgi:hypothetical protein